MTVLYVVKSAAQRENKRGGYFITRDIGKAVDKALRIAKRDKKRMYVIALKKT